MLRTLARTVTLAAASAVTAEFLLGDQYLSGFASAGQQIFMLVLFMIFYGSGAILIREIARRTGRGWPTILLLALAFGVIEEGLLTQSLFNPDYAGAHLLTFGYIDWLGTSGPWLVFVLTLHVVWSMGSPIAITEALFSSRRPWLGRVGLIITPILFALGAAAIFALSIFSGGGFLATWWQLAASAVVAIILIVAALRMPRAGNSAAPTVGATRVTPARAARTTGYANVWLSLVIGLALSTAFQLVRRMPDAVSPWLVTVLMLATIALGIVLALRLRLDPFGLAAGAIVTYCWVGLIPAIHTEPGAVIEQVVLIVIAWAVLVIAARRRTRGITARN